MPPVIIEEPFHINSKLFHFLLIKPGGCDGTASSFLLWIGEPSNPSLGDLSLSLGKCSTSIIGDDLHLLSSKLSLKLSSKFNHSKPVYVSLNISPSIQTGDFLKQLDEQIVSFLKKHLTIAVTDN